MQMVTTTRYSVIFQKFPSRVRVAQKILSSVRVAGTRWGLLMMLHVYYITEYFVTKGINLHNRSKNPARGPKFTAPEEYIQIICLVHVCDIWFLNILS